VRFLLYNFDDSFPFYTFEPFLRPIKVKINLRFVAFPATEYDEVLSGYKPGQMVER